MREKVVALALDEPDLSPREIAVAFTDRQRSFVSEAGVYRLLKARGLVTSPAFIVMKAADKFANPTTAINQLWQTDFTYLKVTGWGWFYLSTVLDDFSRYIVAWKLCTTMAAADVTETLELALQASGLDQAGLEQRPRAAAALRQRAVLRRRRSVPMARGSGNETHARQALPSHDPGQDRALAPVIEEPFVGKTIHWIVFQSSSPCSRTTICQVISNAPSPTSSSTTITGATTKASTISRRPTSTSAEASASADSERRSSAKPSSYDADCI